MGTGGRRNYPWASMVQELRARPGEWRLFSEMVAVPYETIDRVRRRSVRPLRLDDGKIYARAGTRVHSGGRLIADVWLRYLPNERETHEQPE